jgi:FAD/FMN-containing dehydrogenase
MTLIDAVADILAAYPALSDGGFSGYGGWGLDKVDSPISGAPAPVMENGGYSHVFAKLADSEDALEEAQSFVFSALMQRLKHYNGSGLMISESWERYLSFGDYYTAATRAQQPVGYSKMAITSRLLDKSALTGDNTQLKEMLRITSTNSPDVSKKASIWTMLFLVGGGKVLEDPTAPSTDRYVGVHPAWRKAYLLAIPTSILPEDADDRAVKGMQNDTTYRKTDTMRALAPGMGSYLNDGDRNDPWWQTDFFGDNYPRLKAIKDVYDPNHVFYCSTCVGSEEWREILLKEKAYGPLCRA